MNFCSVVMVGRVVRDVEMKYLQSGMAVTDNALAITTKLKDGEDTTFIDFSIFGRTAEVFGEYVKKGHPVLLSGKLRQDKWTTAEGKNMSKLKVVVDTMQMLTTKKDNVESGKTSSKQEVSTDSPAKDGEDIPF